VTQIRTFPCRKAEVNRELGQQSVSRGKCPLVGVSGEGRPCDFVGAQCLALMLQLCTQTQIVCVADTLLHITYIFGSYPDDQTACHGLPRSWQSHCLGFDRRLPRPRTVDRTTRCTWCTPSSRTEHPRLPYKTNNTVRRRQCEDEQSGDHWKGVRANHLSSRDQAKTRTKSCRTRTACLFCGAAEGRLGGRSCTCP
jgi:hypothetical protein